MKLDLQEIKKWPLTTNQIIVKVDLDKFFSKYDVVSYYSQDKEYKNMAYEQLSDIPFVSVCGIKTRWDSQFSPFTRFFILTEKNASAEVLQSLRSFDKIKSRIEDHLEDYTEKQQQRILSSLAINSLGERKAGKMMYNNGCLLLCDDKNYLIPKSKKELVCLKIEVNDYMVLTAKTTSFSNPKTIEELHKTRKSVFQVSKDIYGQWWSGLAVKPVILKKIKNNDLRLEDFYIQKKRFKDNHNIVNYWPYNPEDYTHGRLFALSQVVESVNERFKSLLSIEFTDHEVAFYDEYRTDKETLAFIKTHLNGRSIYFDDPFKNKGSRAYISKIKKEFQKIMENSLVFPTKPSPNDMVIKLCEPNDEKTEQTHYLKSLSRLPFSGYTAIQHVIYSGDETEDSISISEARRLLIELLVKDCLTSRKIPEQLGSLAYEWEFMRYKIQDNCVIGASLKLSEDNTITIEDFGFPTSKNIYIFDVFSNERLSYSDSEKICGTRDYMALKKNGNVYLIIDTDEIPILDVSLIDDAYGKIVNNNEPLALFKRKKDAHKYLRGYIGFHLWKAEGIDGGAGAYSYISGKNSENMQIMRSTKMDKMPRARRILVLHSSNKTNEGNDIMEIENMLRLGFGRWNEMMTYPYPFKFLQEYLDDACETAFSKHWGEL